MRNSQTKTAEVFVLSRKKYMVCLGIKPWDEVPDRTQHLMAHLEGFTIFYFHPPTEQCSFPTLPEHIKVAPHIYSYALPKEFNADKQKLLTFLNQKRLAQYIMRVLGRQRVRSFMLWASHPSQLEVVDKLPCLQLLYDAWDYWSGNVHHVHLARKADMVFAVSKGMKKDLMLLNRNVVLLQNAVKYSLFQDLQSFPDREEIGDFFGFYGEISEDLDLSSLLYAAQRKPDWIFCLVGTIHPENIWIEELTLCPNVRFCGTLTLPLTVDFLFSCAVLMDFRTDTPMSDIYPNRIYEYFSTGKPVVATLWRNEIERFADVVYSAYDHETFLEYCEIALAERESIAKKRRRKYGKNSSWKRRAERIRKVFTTAGYLD